MTACEHGPTAPGRGPGTWFGPRFQTEPNAPAADTGCGGNGEAYGFNDQHILTVTATFYPPNSSQPRGQCGALAFADTLVTGSVALVHSVPTPIPELVAAVEPPVARRAGRH